jgi:dihydrofolate reductase
MTLDHFVAHEDGSLDGFLSEGDHVAEYLHRLQGFDTVVMGRGTYEFGYRCGLKPGARVYPHMRHYIFSTRLRLGADAEVTVVDRESSSSIR